MSKPASHCQLHIGACYCRPTQNAGPRPYVFSIVVLEGIWKDTIVPQLSKCLKFEAFRGD